MGCNVVVMRCNVVVILSVFAWIVLFCGEGFVSCLDEVQGEEYVVWVEENQGFMIYDAEFRPVEMKTLLGGKLYLKKFEVRKMNRTRNFYFLCSQNGGSIHRVMFGHGNESKEATKYSFGVDEIIDFQVNSWEDSAYITTVEKDLRVVSFVDGTTTILIKSTQSGSLIALTLDHVSDCIYYTECSEDERHLRRFDLKANKKDANFNLKVEICFDFIAINVKSKEITAADSSSIYKIDSINGSSNAFVNMEGIISMDETSREIFVSTEEIRGIIAIDRETSKSREISNIKFDSILLIAISKEIKLEPPTAAPVIVSTSSTPSLALSKPHVTCLSIIVLFIIYLTRGKSLLRTSV